MMINKDGLLILDEEDLVHWIIRDDEYFDPVVIPTIAHIPWMLKNIPIPRGTYNKVISALRDKIKSKFHEPSSYRSQWFTDVKKDDRAVPSTLELYAESLGGHLYTVFDLFVGFDQRALTEQSRDLQNITRNVSTHLYTNGLHEFDANLSRRHDVWTWKSIFIVCGWCKVSYLPTHGNRLEHDLN